jgi:cysteinyl-tRNA synthetase
MSISLYNTLTRSKDAFTPLDTDSVRMYVCGPTVYDYVHIGNAVPAVAFDVLFRLLRHTYGEDHVTYVRNITDVDDKIIERAAESGDDITSLTARTAEAYQRDMAGLNNLAPSVEPRATDHITHMIEMISGLIDKGHAYAAEGHVLFRVASDPDYGVLSRRSLDDMIAGARVEVAPYKEEAGDFVLWKPSDDDTPGWESPWGRGRPGWHIECSAMSKAYLGETFDIHGGGIDLIFPHHENEIAQSACSHGGAPLANVWMHNGFITVEGQKMSKSLGNFFTVHELLEDWPGEVLRYTLIAGNYRQPLDWTQKGVTQARQNLDRLYTALRGLDDVAAAEAAPDDRLVAALGDDLNTPLALSVLHDLAGQANRAEDDAGKARLKGVLLASADLLGLLQMPVADWFQGGDDVDAAAIEEMIAQRTEARKNKDFAESDRIRDALAAQGIILEDGPEGTSWKKA